MLLDGALALWIAASGAHAPDPADQAEVWVLIDAPALWAPDTQLVLELGPDRFEVTGRGGALGMGPLLVRLVDAGSCRVLARFEAEAGNAYAIRLGDVATPTVVTRPIEHASAEGRSFERIDYSGCQETRDAGLNTVAATAIATVAVATLLVVRLVARRSQRK